TGGRGLRGGAAADKSKLIVITTPHKGTQDWNLSSSSGGGGTYNNKKTERRKEGLKPTQKLLGVYLVQALPLQRSPQQKSRVRETQSHVTPARMEVEY
ncbi:hypothetical protein J6590_101347, partial [Homalodisca vitripennis]